MSGKIDERVLDERLGVLECARSWSPRVMSKLENHIRTPEDVQLFRTNPIRFATEKNVAEGEAIDLFLHGTARSGVTRTELDRHTAVGMIEWGGNLSALSPSEDHVLRSKTGTDIACRVGSSPQAAGSAATGGAHTVGLTARGTPSLLHAPGTSERSEVVPPTPGFPHDADPLGAFGRHRARSPLPSARMAESRWPCGCCY